MTSERIRAQRDRDGSRGDDGSASTRTGRDRLHALSVVIPASVVIGLAMFGAFRLLCDPGGEAPDGLLQPRVPALTLLFRLVSLLALATCGGIALLRPMLRDPSPSRAGRSTNLPSLELFSTPSAQSRRIIECVTWVVTGVGVAGCVLGAAIGQVSAPQCALGIVLFATVGWFVRHARGPVSGPVLALTGLVLMALWVVLFAGARVGVPRGLDLVYGVTASVLLGACLYGVIPAEPTNRAGRPSAAPEPASAAVRLALLGLSAGVVCSLAGVAQLAWTGPRTWPDALAGGYGLLALGQAGLPLIATVAWWTRWRSLRRPERGRVGPQATTGLWAGFGAMVLAVGAGAALVAVASPPAGPVPGEPLLRPAQLGQHRLAVMVTPMRPGPNLVALSDPGGENRPTMGMPLAQLKPKLTTPVTVRAEGADGARAIAGSRSGASGQWALIDIPAGSRRLTLETVGAGGPTIATVPIDVGTDRGDIATQQILAGPDGPECVSGQLGAILAGATPAAVCPAQELNPSDSASLTDAVDFLAHHQVSTIAVASDDSPRSVAAARMVRSQASRSGLRVAENPGPNDTVLVVTGWARALDALHALTLRVSGNATGGAVLAPWLATAPVLSGASSEMVPLRFDPEQPTAKAYLTTLASLFPGAVPSPAGYGAWAAHLDPSGPTRTRFYGATRADPTTAAPTGPSDQDGPDSWYPGGDLVGIN